MRRLWLAILSALVITSLASAVAFASSVHLKGGRNAKPAYRDGGLNLNSKGELAGLGYGDVLVVMDAQTNVKATCTNPSGANQPPGQNPAPISVSGSQSIPATEIKNGNTPFNVTTVAPARTIAGAPDCPNPNWTETIEDLAFTSAVIRIYQGGALVLTVEATFSPATADGNVPNGNVSVTSY